MRAAIVVGIVLGLSTAASTAKAQVAVPAGFRNATFVPSISAGTAMAFSPDGRLFVCQQTGAVRVIKQGQLLSTPFATLTVDSAGERGLLGLAFDPQFASNQFVYVYYTATTTPRRNRVSRFTAAGDVAVPGIEVVILELDQPVRARPITMAARWTFGPDGALYVAVGDNATGSNAQTLAQPARQDPAHQRRRHHPDRQPVLQPVASGVNRGHLGARSEKSVHLRRSRPVQAACTSTTSAQVPSRRSTKALPAPTTAGRSRRVPRARRDTPDPSIGTAIPPAAPQTAAPLPEARSIRRRQARFRRAITATTSSPTSAAGSSVFAMPPPASSRLLPPGCRSRSISTSVPMAVCITCRAADRWWDASTATPCRLPVSRHRRVRPSSPALRSRGPRR